MVKPGVTCRHQPRAPDLRTWVLHQRVTELSLGEVLSNCGNPKVKIVARQYENCDELPGVLMFKLLSGQCDLCRLP